MFNCSSDEAVKYEGLDEKGDVLRDSKGQR